MMHWLKDHLLSILLLSLSFTHCKLSRSTMAKQLLHSLLVKFLGEFVELDESNLSLAVWSGQIKLNNLKLRTDNILKGHQFQIYHGIVQSLEVTIPWRSLWASPLKIKLNGVLLDMGPIDINSLQKADILRGMLERKLQKLALVDKYLEMSQSMSSNTNHNNSSTGESFVQSWTSQIIDNIEVSLSQVHLRYEDHISVPGQVFAAGLTLESFTLSTCDEKWNPAFIKKSNKPDAYVNKMATLNNLGFYWEPMSDMYSSLAMDRWQAVMLDMIHSNTKPQTDLHYIIAPAASSMVLKLIHRSRPAENNVQFDVRLESKDLAVSIDSLQFQQIFQLYYRIDALHHVHDPNSHRPLERPTSSPEAARQWWKYAKILVLAQPKYVRFVKLYKTAQLENVLPEVLLSDTDLAYMEELESRLPLSILRTFRQKTIKEMIEDSNRERQKEMNKESSTSWWGWGGSANKEDDISIDSIIDELEHQTATGGNALQSLKLSLKSSSVLILSRHFRPIMEATMALQVSVQSLLGQWSVCTEVMDINVADKLHGVSVHSSLMCVKQTRKGNGSSKKSSKNEAIMSLKVENKGSKILIAATALPVEIFVNKHCIHAIILALAVPKNTFEKKLRRVLSINRVENGKLLQQAVLAGSQLSTQVMQEVRKNSNINAEITLELHAPKIIIPEDCSQDRGCLLLDCGFLSTKGLVCSTGVSFAISLKSINAGLPFFIHDLSSIADRSLYLIKPFDLNVDYQSIDTSIADSTGQISISPEMRGEIDADKLGRLLRTLTSLSDIASPKRPDEVNTTVQQDPDAISGPAPLTPEKSVSDSEGFVTPIQMSAEERELSQSANRKKSGRVDFAKHSPTAIDFNPQDVKSLKDTTAPWLSRLGQTIRQSSMTISKLIKSPIDVDRQPPTNINMRVGFTLPLMVLDCTYNAEKGYHSIIAIKDLLLDMVNRPYDRTIIFDIKEFIVQDSYRHESQVDVVRTGKSQEHLVHVHFTSILDRFSPLYTKYASEVKAEFAELFMNVDVNTLLHLQPIISTLLDKKNRSQPTSFHLNQSAFSMQSVDSDHMDYTSSFTKPVTLISPNSESQMPNADEIIGMKVDMSITKIAVDLLHVAKFHHPNTKLDAAFSLQIEDMDLAINMQELMQASVRLRTFDILDIRAASREYVFRKLFCPIASETQDSTGSALLYITYAQESKIHSFITVQLSGMRSFVAMDTILEFSNLAQANFFALTSLLATPNAEEGEQQSPIHEGRDNDERNHSPPPYAVDDIPLKTNTMNVTVKMVNSQLILLEDPAMKESQAIVGRCATEVHFSRDTKYYTNSVELYESVHVTVADNEIFVVKDMCHWNPLPILQPFDVECHFKRTIVNNETVYTSVQLELDDINARLSFNDLLLAQAIMNRRSLVNTPSSSQIAPASSSNSTSVATSPRANSFDDDFDDYQTPYAPPTQSTEALSTPAVMVRFGVTSMNVVLVNDFNAISVPVVKLSILDTNFYSEGAINQLTGEGSVQMKLDYYNAKISTWEPVVDCWTPMFRLYSESLSNVLEVKSEHTLQLTISGAMLETILKSYKVFFFDEPRDDRRESMTSSGITVYNLLGDQLLTSLTDSSAKHPLCQIEDQGEGVVTEIMEMNRKALVRTYRLPDAVDVQITGAGLRNARQSLLHLPFNIVKPKACFLQPVESPSDSLILEPIEEEVFENSRYDPLSGSWKKPFLPGDPYEWTDASGLVRKDIASISINSELWEWSGNWDVDLDGIVGQEIDGDGWEYAASFSYFSMVSPRRAFQALDCVRRRRWIRVRSPKIPVEDFELRALTVVWDVQSLPNGTRKVDIRSNFQIMNNLGFPLRIALSHHSWSSDFEFGSIDKDCTYNVPLLKSYATHVRFKPDFPSYEWSAYVPCNIHSYDCKVVKEISCKAGDASSVTFRSWTVHENKAISVVLLPYITVYNKLLCSMQYKLISSDGKQEVNAVASGSNSHCSHVNLFNAPKIAVKLGRFNWSQDFTLDTKKGQKGLLVLHEEDSREPGSTSAPMLPICIKSSLDKNFCLIVELYFQAAVIDYSSLDLLVKAKFNQSKDLICNLSTARLLTSDTSLNNTTDGMNLVSNLQSSSNFDYEVIVLDIGSRAYVDHNVRFTHLPRSLRHQTYIRTANCDKISRSSEFITFAANTPLVVCLLVDVNTNLKWLKADGFTRTSGVAVARRISKNKLTELHYHIYGKVYQGGEEVILKGAWDKDVQCMYIVCLLPITPDSSSSNLLIREILFASQKESSSSMDVCWIEGGNHASAFYSEDNLLSVRSISENIWSEDINIDTRSNSSTRGSFEIHSYRTGLSYQLSYSIQNLPGLYHQTQLVTFMPKFVILNCTEEPIMICQKGSNKYIVFQPYVPEGWHIVDNHFSTEVKLRTAQTLWSLGSLSINDIGTSVIYIPYAEYNEQAGSRGIVLHVEVKLAQPSDHCSVIVLIWRESVESQASMSIHNDSDVPITIRQNDIERTHDVGDKLYLYELTVPAGKHVPFGWTDPDCSTSVQVAVGLNIAATKRIAMINMLKAGQRLRLPYSNTKGVVVGEIVLDLTISDAGHVLHVSRSNAALYLEITNEETTLDVLESQFAVVPLIGLNIVLGSLGVSLVVEKPTRKELFSLYMDRIELFFKSKGMIKTLDFSVLDLQIDNYSESAVYPVFIRSTKKEVHNSIAMEDEVYANEVVIQETSSVASVKTMTNSERPFIEMSIAMENNAHYTKRPIIKYFAFRILSVVVEVDSATMQLLFLDLLDDLKILSADQTLAINMPSKWLSTFNYNVYHPGQKLIDIYASKSSSLQSKMYIKQMIIHPMKVTITFFQTAFPRRNKKETLQSTVLNAMMSLVGVENMQIRLNSFEVEDAMESYETLASLIYARAMLDVRSQLASIAGSLAMIGSPVGLARKIGSGVKAFFYEPYLGAVHGSHHFLSGLRKGTQRLFRGVVVGSLESAVAVLGTASRGMSYLTGDAEFVRKRALKRQINRANPTGLYGGFRDGGESLVSGIASGVSGLLAKPIEEAAKGGFAGFFRGIGLGMIGVAVKPLVGLTEGMTSIASGLSHQFDPSSKYSYVRPPRALQPSVSDPSVLVIFPLNLDAAFAQEFVAKRARQENYHDSFLSYIPLPGKNEAMILSELYVFWRRPKSLWGRVWANVSHCVFNHDSVGIYLYSGALRGEAELVLIPCGSFQRCKAVYASLAANAYRMGNPAKVLPVDLLPASHHITGDLDMYNSNNNSIMNSSNKESASNALVEQVENKVKLQEAASRLSELDTYRFGSVNGRIQPTIAGSEADILTRWQFLIQKGVASWKELDEMVWNLIWDWGCIHVNLSSCRCNVTVIINKSESPIQFTRVQMLLGRKILILGSDSTGYELESRLLRPRGYVVVFIAAFSQSPLELGHLKANIVTVAFSAVLASTQRETRCEAKGGFVTGFLEKTASEWWSKNVLLVT